MTIPPLPERLSSLPAKTVSAIEAYGQAAYRCGVQYGMGQAAHSIQMRLTEARNEGHKDGWTAAMTQQTKMPEPAVWRSRYRSPQGMIGHYPWSYVERSLRQPILNNYDIESLITTDQAEAYAAAKVREALEEAARRCVESPMMNTDVYCGGTARLCADRIRALIQPAKESKNG